MNIEKDKITQHRSRATLQSKGAGDADVLLLLWETFRARGMEVDHLLDLSLSIVSSAPQFEQKTDLEASLKKALILVRNIA